MPKGCEFCRGESPMMIGAMRSSIEELVPWRIDINEFERTLVIATNHDESYMQVSYCPMCGRELPNKEDFIKRVEEYFHG